MVISGTLGFVGQHACAALAGTGKFGKPHLPHWLFCTHHPVVAKPKAANKAVFQLMGAANCNEGKLTVNSFLSTLKYPVAKLVVRNKTAPYCAARHKSCNMP
jgi:hypothetical protein